VNKNQASIELLHQNALFGKEYAEQVFEKLGKFKRLSNFNLALE